MEADQQVIRLGRSMMRCLLVCVGSGNPDRSHDDQAHRQPSENKRPGAVNDPSERHSTPPRVRAERSGQVTLVPSALRHDASRVDGWTRTLCGEEGCFTLPWSRATPWKCARQATLRSDGKGSCLVGSSSHLLVSVNCEDPRSPEQVGDRATHQGLGRQRCPWRQIVRRRATDASGASCWLHPSTPLTRPSRSINRARALRVAELRMVMIMNVPLPPCA